ncbi:class I SAM-dependent methyltransferase [Vallicoccus soli]|uniref:Class I SAM-dependent methyltransferase n=1 Tax=Vallicoccus soli TaxID=2339232 RepID=A0A3A3YUE5_9ACTN|nr:class I SAM-dependent methyltransferase [Vallicoccus soli]
MNRALWDERAPAHAASPDYGLARFVDDPEHLSDVVRFDLPRLGDVSGLRGVHLQCHLGTDTLSLARRGATMTGLDFSAASVEQARRLAAAAGPAVEYVHADVHDAVEVLGAGAFDLVYTGIGALCWLPSVERWAGVVAGLLRPGGRLFLREAHPVLWALDDARDDGVLALRYPYVERVEPDVWDEDGTYVATDVRFTHTRSSTWNHGLGEVVTALLARGLRLTMLQEHDSVPWDALPGLMEDVGGGEKRLREAPWRLPHTYTLQAVKEADPAGVRAG